MPASSRLTGQDAPPDSLKSRAAIFLDRDGVLNEDVHHLRSIDQLRILPGVPEALRTLQEQFYLVVVTNQAGIARDFFSEADLLAVHTELVRRLLDQGVMLDALYYCPHLVGGPVKEYGIECGCRKPEPGMLLRAASEWRLDESRSFMVGDNPWDVEAGLAAGVASIQVGDSATTFPKTALVASDLASATQLILRANHSTAAAG
jgi:D-glycero-D-manno-heptose 1,7-bisphosphate phosphatase